LFSGLPKVGAEAITQPGVVPRPTQPQLEIQKLAAEIADVRKHNAILPTRNERSSLVKQEVDRLLGKASLLVEQEAEAQQRGKELAKVSASYYKENIELREKLKEQAAEIDRLKGVRMHNPKPPSPDAVNPFAYIGRPI
jgi:hypothetical protein